jgi:hypothetical protein
MYTGLTKETIGPFFMLNINEPRFANIVLSSEKCLVKPGVIYDQVPFGEGLFTVNDCKLKLVTEKMRLVQSHF